MLVEEEEKKHEIPNVPMTATPSLLRESTCVSSSN